MRRLTILLTALCLAFGVAACGDDPPPGCYDYNGELVCPNQGGNQGGDDDEGYEEFDD